VLFPALVAAIVGYAIYGAITSFTPVFGEVPAHFDVSQLPRLPYWVSSAEPLHMCM